MVVAAESLGHKVTAGGDKRITGMGKVLRKTKLDELPQLINVLRGDMSFVGPRPEVQEFVEYYPEQYAKLLTFRPGITDLASIEFRHEEEILAQFDDPQKAYIHEIMPRKIELGLKYISNASLAYDVRIIFATAMCIFSREGV